jgi:hypothetical protein
LKTGNIRGRLSCGIPSFTAKPQALARLESGLRHREANRSASPAVAYGSAVNERRGKRARPLRRLEKIHGIIRGFRARIASSMRL